MIYFLERDLRRYLCPDQALQIFSRMCVIRCCHDGSNTFLIIQFRQIFFQLPDVIYLIYSRVDNKLSDQLEVAYGGWFPSSHHTHTASLFAASWSLVMAYHPLYIIVYASDFTTGYDTFLNCLYFIAFQQYTYEEFRLRAYFCELALRQCTYPCRYAYFARIS